MIAMAEAYLIVKRLILEGEDCSLFSKRAYGDETHASLSF